MPSFFEAARSIGLAAIPVTGLDRPANYQEVIAEYAKRLRNGACLRVTRQDLEDQRDPSEVLGKLSKANLQQRDVDLILDLDVWDSSASEVAAHFSTSPNIDRWRSFAMTSGSFPKNLIGLLPGRRDLPRQEWLAWSDLQSRWRWGRRPAFGDFTIQFGRYEEPPENANVSASIRYATPDFWLVMRGEALRLEDGPGWKQYPANAELLSLQEEFLGPDFSYGDDYIWRIGTRQLLKTGSPETWLVAGINHHLVLTARQVSGKI